MQIESSFPFKLSILFAIMKFPTSPSVLCMLALTATIFSLDSLTFASAKSLLAKEKNKESFESDGSNNGFLTLINLDPTKLLTKADAAFMEEALRDVFKHVSPRERNGPGDTLGLHPTKHSHCFQ